MQRGDALTFFFSDIEGSTRAASALGDRFADALDAHRRAVRTALARHGGTEVSTAGDSFFAVFDDPGAALAAAVAIQSTSTGPIDAGELRARIGLHTGNALRVGDDYLGLEVHRAARISDAGHGGQVLVSDATREALGGLPDGLSLIDLGRHRLKDVGPERLWQVAGGDLPPGPFAAPRSLEAHPTNLPVESTPLIDREVERGDLRSLVMASPLVVVTGPGGIGKTRLALAVARSLVPDLADGVFHLDLTSTPDASHLVSELIEVLALRIGPEEAPLAGLLDRLRNRDILIVLDTADRVDLLADLVAAIASACPRVHVLVTSRSPLHVAAEREYPVAALSTDAAVELYAARARALRPGFELDEPTRDAVARLVARLDRIPLAVELAAARARLLTPAALLDRLERRLPALGEASRDAPDRQRTLQATIAWSCELLAPQERLVFEQLGILEPAFDLAAIEGIVELPGDADVALVVEALVDRSLVASDIDERSEPRFRLLGPMREFALEALRANGAEAAARERHAAYWSGVIRREAAVLDQEGGLEAIVRIGRDEPNIHQALAWMLAEQPEAGAELVASLGRYWRLRGRVAEGLAWLTRAAAIGPAVSTKARAGVLFWKGALEDDARRPPEAAASLAAALELRRELGDELGVARALNSLGIVTRSQGDLDAAERMLRESIELARAVGDRRGVAMALSNLGIVAEDRDEHERAADLMAQALEIDRELGGAYVIVGTANLGVTQVRAGRIDEGVARLREALPGIEELEDPDLVVEALVALAEATLARGDATAAARLALAAEALAAAERHPLHPTDQGKLEALIVAATAALPAAEVAALRAEAGAVDMPGGLALAAMAIAALGL